MRIYLEQEQENWAISRTIDALKKYAPSEVIFLDRENFARADLVVHQVDGRLEHLGRKIEAHKKPYAIVQHAFRSTKNPEPADWMPIWQAARLVWSHHELPDMPNFYRSPLGVERVFHARDPQAKVYDILTSGTYLTEGVRECVLATTGRVAHLGANLNRQHVQCFDMISDDELARLYTQSKRVSGLRRIEGFELPAAEGLCCGARPVLFDRPHYRKWYGDWAEYIPEAPRNDVLESLRKLLAIEPRPVAADEIEAARKRFDWRAIIGQFYGHL